MNPVSVYRQKLIGEQAQNDTEHVYLFVYALLQKFGLFIFYGLFLFKSLLTENNTERYFYNILIFKGTIIF